MFRVFLALLRVMLSYGEQHRMRMPAVLCTERDNAPRSPCRLLAFDASLREASARPVCTDADHGAAVVIHPVAKKKSVLAGLALRISLDTLTSTSQKNRLPAADLSGGFTALCMSCC